jgi:hypothetical protein
MAVTSNAEESVDVCDEREEEGRGEGQEREDEEEECSMGEKGRSGGSNLGRDDDHFWMIMSKSSVRMGFTTMLLYPAAIAFSASASLELPVNAKIGPLYPNCLIMRAAVYPSITGIQQSMKTKSNSSPPWIF